MVRDLHRHRPVGLVADTGSKPLPHLALDHDDEPLHLLHLVEHLRHDRDGHVVGQVRHEHPHGRISLLAGIFAKRGARAQSNVNASPLTTRTPAGSTTDRSRGTRALSISTAVTLAPVSASARVRDPSPAPISTTELPGPTPESRAIRLTVFASTTKFCPSARLG